MPRRPSHARAAGRLALLLAPFVLACASAPPPADGGAAGAAPAEIVGPQRRDPARFDDALRDLEFEGARAVRPRPGARRAGEAPALLAAARTLVVEGRKEEAIRAAAAAVVAAPARPEAYELLAAALRRAHELVRAEAALRTAMRLDRTRVAARLDLADLLWMTARRDAADAEWRRVLSAEPGNGRALVRRAVAAHLRGEPARAARWAAEAAAAGAPLPAPLARLAAGSGEVAAAVPPAAPSTVTSSPEPLEIVVEPPQRLDPGGGHHQSAEPAVAAVRRGDAERVVVAWIDTREGVQGGTWRIATAASDDGGRTFTEAMLPPPAGSTTPFDGDPTLVADPDSGLLWVGAASFVRSPGVWVSRDFPAASGLEPAAFTFAGFADRPWLAIGPLPGDAQPGDPQPGEPGAARLYLAFDRGLQLSDDLGASWSPLLPYSGGVGYLPRVGPGGELSIIRWDVSDGIELLRSLDGGATFEPPVRIATRLDFWDPQDGSRVPGTFRVPPLPVLAVDRASGALYAMWFDTARLVAGDADLDLFFARSDDGGETWSAPRPVLAGAGDQFFPWIEVDAAGRLHLVHFDTGRGGGGDGDPAALLDAVYAVSEDGGETWQTAWLTPEPFSTAAADFPAQLGNQFVGDYLGLAPIDGGAFVAYPAASSAGDLDILGHRVRLIVPCDAGESLCLGGGRFRVSVEWSTAAGDRGVGRPLPLTADSGTFWFFDAANLELVVKVLDGCPVNGHHWVFAAGLTDVGVSLVVDDLETGERRTYSNPQGTAYQPITDTAAFAGCPGQASPATPPASSR